MSISLAKRKNNQFREGSSILFACSCSSSCPVAVMERFLLAGRHHKSDFLFRKICHTKHGFSLRPQPLTYSRASGHVWKWLEAIGLIPSSMGFTASDRVGLPQQLQQHSQIRLLMRHGGWRSESAKKMYCTSRALRLL